MNRQQDGFSNIIKNNEEKWNETKNQLLQKMVGNPEIPESLLWVIQD